MRVRLAASSILFVGLSLAVGFPAIQAETSPVDRISWLGGCWESVRGDLRVEEHWMQPRGGTMLGMARTVAGETTREFEHMIIREDAGSLSFTAKPSGQVEATFGSVELTDSGVVFENKSHDFPQRVIYRKQADGSLLARIEGEKEGKPRGVDFPMKRVACDGSMER